MHCTVNNTKKISILIACIFSYYHCSFHLLFYAFISNIWQSLVVLGKPIHLSEYCYFLFFFLKPLIEWRCITTELIKQWSISALVFIWKRFRKDNHFLSCPLLNIRDKKTVVTLNTIDEIVMFCRIRVQTIYS